MWWITISLIIAGVLLMLVEFLLTPGLGVAGLFSLCSLVAACWYSFENLGSSAAWWVFAAVLLLVVLMLIIILRAKTWNRFELRTEITSKVNNDNEKVVVGQKGVAATRLAPRGTGRFGTLNCEVKSMDNTFLDSGVEIEVVSVEDNEIIVKQI